MTPKLWETIDFEDNKLGNLPNLGEIFWDNNSSIPSRFLAPWFWELSADQISHILSYLMRMEPDSDLPKKVFNYNSVPRENLAAKRQQFEKDISDVHWKIYDSFEHLSFSQSDIDYFYPQIITIYKQILEKSLSEIEAQVDMQITTITNNIMLRNLNNWTIANQVAGILETRK